MAIAKIVPLGRSIVNIVGWKFLIMQNLRKKLKRSVKRNRGSL